MQFFSAAFRLFKMLFACAQFFFTILLFVLNGLRIICKLACVGFPWFLFTSISLLLILTRYFKLKKPSPKIVESVLGEQIDGVNYKDFEDVWPVANRGASLDALENSATAIKKCAAQKCHRILLDVELTKCGELVIFHNAMLERIWRKTNETAGIKPISSMTLEEIQKLDITENHPLGEKYAPESIMTFNELIKVIEREGALNVFLLIAPRNKMVVAKFSELLKQKEIVDASKRIIFCSRSPLIIYQLRKIHQDMLCGLWLDKISKANLPQFLCNSALFISALGAFYRNIIAFVLGISVVFLHKNEYNAHLGNLWRNVGIRPIVYTINSPNEKRYFQSVLRTQYLTDSLRSEPHHFLRINK